MGSGITNDPTGVFDTPKTGSAEIDSLVTKYQAEDARRRAAAAKKAAAKSVPPNRHVGGDVYLQGRF